MDKFVIRELKMTRKVSC